MYEITLRQYYAGIAMQALLLRDGYYSNTMNLNGWTPKEISQYAFEYSDAMIKEGVKFE